MFDGSEVEAPTSVSAVIGKKSIEPDAEEPLLRGPQWPIRMAFFASENKVSEPIYEMSINMHDNGIASVLELDYGDFTVTVELKTLEALPQPAC